MSTTKLATEVFQILRERGIIDKVLDYLLKKEPMTVLVMGASGTGKSAFLKKLYNEEPFIHPNDRSRINEVKAGKVEGSLFEVIATPGQRDLVHGKTRLEAIKDAARAKRLGIINVVSHGYHEVSDSVSNALDGGKVSEEYLKSRRAEELLMLPEWVGLLCGPGGNASWLITVITKADIWWGTDEHNGIVGDEHSNDTEQPDAVGDEHTGSDGQTEVAEDKNSDNGEKTSFAEYYMSDPYIASLGDAASLPHAVHTYSALNQKFYGMVSPSGHYTDDQRKLDHNALIATLLEYASNAK